jgi:hypothetical protein
VGGGFGGVFERGGGEFGVSCWFEGFWGGEGRGGVRGGIGDL